jgi:hypothetical protein
MVRATYYLLGALILPRPGCCLQEPVFAPNWEGRATSRDRPLPEAVPALEDLEDGDHGRGPGRRYEKELTPLELKDLPHQPDFLFVATDIAWGGQKKGAGQSSGPILKSFPNRV